MIIKPLDKKIITSSPFDRHWILRNSIEEIKNYKKGVLTIRGLHYRLVSRGMTNDINHYKKVSKTLSDARWDGIVDFDTFSDNDREMIGRTKYEETTVKKAVSDSKYYIDYYLNNYYKNSWENQPIYPEVFIEKKALQGTFVPICEELDVAVGACKGYASLTFIHEAAVRMLKAYRNGKTPYILYFGDYDPSGEDIPRSIEVNLNRMGCDSLVLKRILLKEEQVLEWGLPPAPTKSTDSRTANWDGIGQVELDSVEPKLLQKICREEIENIFDKNLYEDLIEIQQEEAIKYKKKLKKYIAKL